MIVDDRFCTVGSTNLNSRSLRYDYEINAFIFDLPLTDELGHIFHEDKQCSTIMTREEYKNALHGDDLWDGLPICLPP